jgi:hypothetical protein
LPPPPAPLPPLPPPPPPQQQQQQQQLPQLFAFAPCRTVTTIYGAPGPAGAWGYV